MYKYRFGGFVICAFGVGLMLGSCFPEKLILIVVSLLLVGAGLCISKM